MSIRFSRWRLVSIPGHHGERGQRAQTVKRGVAFFRTAKIAPQQAGPMSLSNLKEIQVFTLWWLSSDGEEQAIYWSKYIKHALIKISLPVH